MKKILILYNARSGHRRLSFQSYLRELAEHDAETQTRTIGRKFNLRELLSDASVFDRVVVAGGDGTVSAAAGILQNSNIPILAYPGGTANLLARNLNLPSDPKKLADITLNGKLVRTDLGELEFMRYTRRDLIKSRILKRGPAGTLMKKHFAVMAGCGFAASLMLQAQPWKASLGEASYWIGALTNPFPRRSRFRVKLDGREIEARGIGILIINFARIQFDLQIVAESAGSDGKLDIAIVKARSLPGLMPVVWSALWEKFGFKRPLLREMESYQASELEISMKPPLRLQFDGEILQKSSSFKARVLPAAALFVSGTPAS